jgi:hypothetical protein
MIKLEKEFKSGAGGFAANQRTFKQLAENGQFAVYERSFDDKIEGYEVFKITVLKKGTQVFAQTIAEDTEQYPSNNKFGFTAWCLGGKDSYFNAMTKYEALIKGAIAVEDTGEDETTEAPETPTVPKVKGTRGRPAHTRPAIKLPNSAKFTMSQLVDLNQDAGWTQPLIYVDIQKQIESGILKEDGKVEKEPGQRGKSALYYALAQ